MNKKKIITIIIAAFAAVSLGGILVGNPIMAYNNHRLKKAVISAAHQETVALNEIIPFDWDAVYTFSPYADKAEIEKTIGFHSTSVKANNINEGMVHLLFVKDKKVMASVLGYSDHLGYRIDFPSKVTFAENALFHVSNSDGIVTLAYVPSGAV
ncbi:hypothetical protein [Clostridium transplantifaecale]|uniref:hypothetical protein n=1 Tax=Clostridium transplantifaecale TaxID=2479838 RepID=UPI000F637713|nr:hypothetical protein [Clostridium transplantifaecale]